MATCGEKPTNTGCSVATDGSGNNGRQKALCYNRQLRPGIDAATEALGEQRCRQSHERGRAMSVEEATEFLRG